MVDLHVIIPAFVVDVWHAKFTKLLSLLPARMFLMRFFSETETICSALNYYRLIFNSMVIGYKESLINSNGVLLSTSM